MLPVVFKVRADWGAPAVQTGSTGVPRPRLSRARWMTVHYTGVSALVNGRPRYPADMDVRQFLANLEASMRVAGKPGEYNYVVPPRVDVAEIWEYAGEYQGAHSAGENEDAVGVLLVLGVGQAITRGQIEAVRWLRDVHLPARSLLAPDAVMLPHRAMPDAMTPCPGPVVDEAWPLLELPYVLPPSADRPVTPIVIPTQEEPTMSLFVLRSEAGEAALVETIGPSMWGITDAEISRFGVKVVEVSNATYKDFKDKALMYHGYAERPVPFTIREV